MKRIAVALFASLSSVAMLLLISTSRARTGGSQEVPVPTQKGSKSINTPDFRGGELPVKYECLESGLDQEGRDPAEIEDAKVAVLTGGGMLVGICNTLFDLDQNAQLVWQHTVAGELIDFAFIPSTGLVYVTALDNNLYILDAANGSVLLNHSRNGAMAYGRVLPYLDDICLVTDDNSMYRSRLSNPSLTDSVTAWRGTEALWNVELPPGAVLAVRGSRILALTASKEGAFLQEVAVPKPY